MNGGNSRKTKRTDTLALSVREKHPDVALNTSRVLKIDNK